MGPWMRWIGQWALYWLWMAGWWIALFFLMAFSIFMFWPFKSLLWPPIALAFVGASLLVYQGYRNAPYAEERVPQDPDEYEEIVAEKNAQYDWGIGFCIGMFCGPVIVIVLYAALKWLAIRLGYDLPDTKVFAFGMLIGSWLGACTWEVTSGVHTPRNARAIQLVGGVAGLCAVMVLVFLHGRGPEGTLQNELMQSALFDLSVPLVWSLLLIFCGSSPVFRRGPTL